MTKYLLIILFASFPFHVQAEYERYKHNKWLVTIDSSIQSVAVYGFETSGVDTTTAQLFLYCDQAGKNDNAYRLGLLTTTVIDVVDPFQVDVSLSVDDNPKLNIGWFQEGLRLESVTPKVHINEMLKGDKLHIQFRDKNELHKYVYPLDDIKDILQAMSQVCMYSYE